MKPLATLSAMLAIAMLGQGCASTSETAMPEMPAYGTMGAPQDFEGLGAYTRTVTTDSVEAQQYFNQGLAWLHAFNHDEAVRCFTKAAQLDPSCAMAWWGIAYAQGPNYNDPMMSPARNAAAWDALQNAIAALDDETAVEQSLVHALEFRYENPAPEDRTRLNAAFANAMAMAWDKHPDDPDVGTFYAEAIMVQHPWEWYNDDQTPAYPETEMIVQLLEDVIALDPTNPGANHLYIHAVEPSADKDRGIAAADRLSNMVPAAGHLNHMPSHIYVQTGMWQRSIEQNAKAMEADDAYRKLAPDQMIQHMYMAHNTHMLAFSAMMIGREDEAIAAAQDMWDDLPQDTLPMVGPFIDLLLCSKYDVLKRFGRWDDLLDEPAPPRYLPITTAVWHAHRAIAYAAKKDIANARLEYDAFVSAKEAAPPPPIAELEEQMESFFEVADAFILGEIALQQRKWDQAIEHLERAVELEDGLGYGEPPLWLQPVRHTLGAVYLAAGRPADAERTYREDLKEWRDNGWSLYGLARALEEQGKDDEALAVRNSFDKAWRQADKTIASSCLCIPET